ncbi:aminomethyl-transferring glycine dehydrogenase [Candidatus Symbiobacter mobilis]|uniref:Glycine dehydrogenase (decarboxylating) n=1 Tax=Candidatus Symbiobacter mobilis CR TaxID=946483 RepID=U5NAS6_9BURK|nr:aminomethyl-transferring glycine dehydrogenase [Candidatus Symbiobacter mobilis]AGX88395.1 glycine dehydrogenase [Candidatus Symbiobacter mobilis CR]
MVDPVHADCSASSTAFLERHLGNTDGIPDVETMLRAVGAASLDALIDEALAPGIARSQDMALPPAVDEDAALAELRAIASENRVCKSYIGQGYYGTRTPAVLLRNVLENPAWYTAYTPYQAEISQGRLEALMWFQTLVAELTALDVANASMLDEATAAAEAMAMAFRLRRTAGTTFLVDAETFPQTIAVLRTRAEPLGIALRVCSIEAMGNGDAMAHGDTTQVPDAAHAAGVPVTPDVPVAPDVPFGALLQYPGASGIVRDDRDGIAALHARGVLVIVAADILALALLTPPGELGADIAIGSTQRLGLPMGNGGPHAAYMACRKELMRALPGRIVGASVDTHGQIAYRLALQTREQHIRRDKATSNVCTAQALPAIVAAMYAVYHGPEGLRRIASAIARRTAVLAQGLRELGQTVVHASAFDTITIDVGSASSSIVERALAAGVNLGVPTMPDVHDVHDVPGTLAMPGLLRIALDETTTDADVEALWALFAPLTAPDAFRYADVAQRASTLLPAALERHSSFLQHPVFHRHHSETAMLRLLRRLSDRDLALDRTMIPLGSCTMKLNATSAMLPMTWPEFADIHPFAPAAQRQGYARLAQQLGQWLCAATGYAGVSLQPNAGSQGEYAGLLVIRAWQRAQGQGHRNVCLIPASAHGTNPASAALAGMQVVPVACDAQGNVDLDDVRAQCARHADRLAAMMLTYPSTHGVFEDGIRTICALVHQHGGRVYIDGANMNAMLGLCAPGEFGGDVSHLNLHKTFAIPHGGGGPGVGPVCVAQDLLPFLPGEPGGIGPVSAAPLGNASVLPISWMYCRMMGARGLREASRMAILHANYLSVRLRAHYPTLYTRAPVGGKPGRVAHECILDLRPLRDATGITAEDVAKRLMDYGFHAPTLSFPVPGTLMVEPTESEPIEELDRFIDAMVAIREEIAHVERGEWPRDDNPLRNAPHTAPTLLAASWMHPYSRERAAALGRDKYWPPVGRIDNAQGDRKPRCTLGAMGEPA